MSTKIGLINKSLGEFLLDFNSIPLKNFLTYDNTFDEFFLKNPFDNTGFPRCNMRNISTENEILLEYTLALPGWNKENSKLDIYIKDDILSVEGTLYKETEDNIKKGKNYGKEYERNISLKSEFKWTHSVVKDSIFKSAKLKDGLLTIIIQVQEEKNSIKRISVE